MENIISKKLLHEVFEREFEEFTISSGEDFRKIHSTIYKFISTLSMYKDEERDLFLDVYFFIDFKSAMLILPQSKYMEFGTEEISKLAEKSVGIIKKLAPLANGVWKLYFNIKEDHVIYGLFRNNESLTAIPIEDHMVLEEDGPYKYIRMYRECKVSISMSNHFGNKSTLYFSSFGEEATSSLENINKLTCCICEELDSTIKDSCITFCNGMLNRAIRQSHGTLVAVINVQNFPLDNYTKFNPPLDFSALIKNLKDDKNDTAVVNLLSHEDLVDGVINSDGIVIFDQKFNLLAFNGFISFPQEHDQHIVGGARTRAFNALCTSGNGIIACFMQSQDGHTKFKVL